MVTSCSAVSCLKQRWVLCGSRTTRQRSFSSSGVGGPGDSVPRAGERLSLAGHIIQNGHRAVASDHPRDWYAGQCDKLSFLRVCLSQMDKVLGGTNGYAPPLTAGTQVPCGNIFLVRGGASSASQAFSTVRLGAEGVEFCDSGLWGRWEFWGSVPAGRLLCQFGELFELLFTRC